MPTYEYACSGCGHEFEREQRISDEPVKTCPACKARKVRRLITQGNFILKGGGWYSDLYSGPSNAKSDGKTSSDGGTGNSKSAEKSTKIENATKAKATKKSSKKTKTAS